MICPHCETFFANFIEHLKRCEVDLDRLIMIGLLTIDKKEFFLKLREQSSLFKVKNS
jgi:glutaredoxin-related protein